MKRGIKIFLTIFFAGSLFGCVAPSYNYAPDSTEISEPPIGTTNTAFVGDSLLRQGKYTKHDAILLKHDVNIGLIGSYTLKRGTYLKQGEDENSGFYLPGGERSGAIIKGALADPPQIVHAYKYEPKICVVTVFNAEACTNKAKFERDEVPIASPDSFQQTLIYSGKFGDKINIGYREFSNNMARPAFNNDVEYDLSESKTIGYKGARLEVIEVTNEYIKYKVIKNFNKAEL